MKKPQASGAKGTASTSKTREDWLSEVSGRMSSWFDDLGFSLPDFRITAGFPSTGKRGRDLAEAWQEKGGESFTVFIRPDRDDAYKVAAALAHQMAHMAAGSADTHGHLFRHIAVSIGLRGRATQAAPGRLFQELIDPILKKAGPLPTTYIGPQEAAQKSKQKTRLIKVSCRTCGYVARVSRKWLDDSGPPHCPQHGPMALED